MTPEQRLDLWLSEEREVVELLNSGPGVGVARPAQLVGKSGLEVMHAMMNGQLPYAEFARHLTFYAIAAHQGSAVFQGTPQREYLNPMGTIHGGWMTSILDSALGCAVLSSLPPGQVYTTAGLETRYVKALTLDVRRVRAEATVTRIEGRTALAEANLVGPDGTLYAKATTECRLFDMRAPAQAPAVAARPSTSATS
ncbi:PaaI family thioesterase [Variovorax sp. UC122_21]|uniref:PaaI family thioesterase n=1 Tax=Variovorax sp. UC122_21 TaxID=3374554 RepID=UPI00375835F9